MYIIKHIIKPLDLKSRGFFIINQSDICSVIK